MYRRQKFTIILRIGAALIALIFVLGIVLDSCSVLG